MRKAGSRELAKLWSPICSSQEGKRRGSAGPMRKVLDRRPAIELEVQPSQGWLDLGPRFHLDLVFGLFSQMAKRAELVGVLQEGRWEALDQKCANEKDSCPNRLKLQEPPRLAQRGAQGGQLLDRRDKVSSFQGNVGLEKRAVARSPKLDDPRPLIGGQRPFELQTLEL